MANFLISTAGKASTGTTGDDIFIVLTGGETKATIQGLAGADVISAQTTVFSAYQTTLQGGAGADTINIDGSNALQTLIAGGQDNDTIDIDLDGVLSISTINGGKGADHLSISANVTDGVLNGNAGADTLTLSAAATYTRSRIGLGADNDYLTASGGIFNGATIAGGKGTDTINLVNNGASDDVRIELDNLSAGIAVAGNDELTDTAGTYDSSTIVGGGGNDTITINGDMSASSLVAGNYGNDEITVSGIAVDTSVKGGNGADTITINANIGSTAAVVGGKGHDSISVSGVGVASASIIGGAGKDTIDIDAAVAADVLNAVIYSAFTESNLSNLDKIDASALASGAVADASGVDVTGSIQLRQDVVSGLVVTDATYGGATANIVVVGGWASGFSAADRLTARVSSLDTAFGTAGRSVIFSDGDDKEYLFMQGGTSGTADDLVIRIDGTQSGSTLTLGAGSAISIDGFGS